MQTKPKLTWAAVFELQVSHSTVHRALWKCLRLCITGCRCSMHSSRWQDIAHRKFAGTILDEKLDKYNEFPRKIILSDEAAFHISGKIHKQNVHIWGSEYTRAAVAYIRDSPKVNTWCDLLQGNLTGPFFCAKATVISTSFLGVLRNLGSFLSGDTYKLSVKLWWLT